MRKVNAVWVEPDGAAARLVWSLWRDGVLYVVTGGGEQVVPDLAGALGATVVIPAKGGRVRTLAFRAAVGTVVAGTAHWTAVVPALVAARLNLPDPAATAARWETSARITTLTPIALV